MAVDMYAANPLAAMYAETNPAKFSAQAVMVEPPKLFQNGRADVPAFTASGIPPEALLRLPWGMRHHVAEMTDISEVYAVFEQYGGQADGRYECDSLRAAEQRMRDWSEQTPDPRPAEVQEAENRAEYESFARSRSADGLLPEEREQARVDKWNARQAAEKAASDARWGDVAARREQRFRDAGIGVHAGPPRPPA